MRVFDSPEPLNVEIQLGAGDVRLLAGDRATTTVDVQPRREGKATDRAAAEAVVVEFSAGTLSIRSPRNWRRFTPGADGSVAVTIELPTGSHVRARSGLGSVDAEGALGRCDLRTSVGRVHADRVAGLSAQASLGDITVDQCDGDATVSMSSGAVRIGELGGAGTIRNSNGETRIGRVTGPLRVNSAHGDIAIGQALASVIARTSRGSIRIDEVVAGDVSLRSAAGGIHVGVRDGSAVWLDLSTNYGDVRSALTAGDPPNPGDPIVRLEAATHLGDVVVDRVALAPSGAPDGLA